MSSSRKSAKFFITHSFKDKTFARRLTDDLLTYGLEGFFDIYSIAPGDDIVSRINKGLNECDVYLPILSFAALKSPWCDEEIGAAIMLSKQPSRKGRPHIIPVLIEDCAQDLPPLLQHRLFLNFVDDYNTAFEQLLVEGFKITTLKGRTSVQVKRKFVARNRNQPARPLQTKRNAPVNDAKELKRERRSQNESTWNKLLKLTQRPE